MNASVTVLKPKDPTSAARSKRYRRNRKLRKTVTMSITVNTVQICQLAARIGGGKATPADLELSERLLLVLAATLPKNGMVGIP